VAVYLLDLPLDANPDKFEYEPGMLTVAAPAHLPAHQNWTLIRALQYSFPGLTYLKDLLLNAENSVVFKNTLLPIHTDRLGGERQLVNFWCSSRKTTTRTVHGSPKSSFLNVTWTSSGNECNRMESRPLLTTEGHKGRGRSNSSEYVRNTATSLTTQ